MQRTTPGTKVVPNGDGTYTVHSPDNPTFVYPTEVIGTAEVVRSEIGGKDYTPAESREDAASSVVWNMRNMVEQGRPKEDGRSRTEYPTYSKTWSQFAPRQEGRRLREDEIVTLQVFLGKKPDITGGGVYMINKDVYDDNPNLKDQQTGQVLWRTSGDRLIGHYFFSFCPCCDGCE